MGTLFGCGPALTFEMMLAGYGLVVVFILCVVKIFTRYQRDQH